ncbi:hypothetical protein NLK61_06390 [Pseudomonas fuscovaginae UPB0736]|uniref:Lipoprotein n=1 Tax=Pseudomonas asplenii TaxID=53407 RepID=A0A1H1N863_9PSED|nr:MULTISPECIES: hypothetical protein [Pseudomonas]UUQ66266.1 hypothetical protein NLK61_06390 [Pseudomonas fuscovaginae UPB0736]UZE30511.1 hypothetical protein LOY63_07175 [Pseudomonas asplenii]SDR95192.1 hypothetical protein SAMN05216598_0048 [Pseudomonas asplenii]
MPYLLQVLGIALSCAVLSSLLSYAAYAMPPDVPGIVTVEIRNDSAQPLELLGTGLDLQGAPVASFAIASGERRKLHLTGSKAWFIYGSGPRKCRFVAQHALKQRFSGPEHSSYLPVWTRQAESIGEHQASCKARLSKTLKAPPYSYSVKFSMG